ATATATLTPTATRTLTPAPTVSGAPLRLSYRTTDAIANDNQIKPQFRLTNTTSNMIALSRIKIRYYFTRDTAQPLVFSCDYAYAGCTNVTSRFVAISPAAATADFYMEVGFTTIAGNILGGGGSTGSLLTRINKADWSNFNENNDYSF